MPATSQLRCNGLLWDRSASPQRARSALRPTSVFHVKGVPPLTATVPIRTNSNLTPSWPLLIVVDLSYSHIRKPGADTEILELMLLHVQRLQRLPGEQQSACARRAQFDSSLNLVT